MTRPDRTAQEGCSTSGSSLLDGSWGVLIQRRGQGRGGLPRRAVRRPSARRRRRSRPAQPDAARRSCSTSTAATSRPARTSRRRTPSPRPRSGRPTTALEAYAAEMNRRGRAARAAGGRRGRRPVRRRLGRPAERHAVDLAEGRRPGFRAVTFDAGARRLRGADAALVEGGVDLLLIETIFDTLNAKAAIVAALDVAPERAALDLASPRSTRAAATSPARRSRRSGRRSSTPTRSSSASTARSARRRCARTSRTSRGSPTPTSRATRTPGCRTPSASTTSSPADTSRYLREFAESGLVNIVGGCCGTTPDHIRAIAARVEGLAPRRVPKRHGRRRASAASSRSRSGRTPTS